MKITKQKFKDVVLEVLREQDQQMDTSGAPTLKSGSKSTAQRATDAVKRIRSAGDELTNAEKNLVDQFEKFLSDLAATPGVDLMRNRALLQRVLVILQKSTASQVTQAAQQAQQAQAVQEACGAAPMPIDQGHGCADDHEASMAKSDLYKAANYATELEQMIQDGEQLDGWVQAKITKAADYLSSVKHHLEYKKIKG
tara:strand:- start:315 stop:905 length:591 start_codon:yes stop_codon:yes gene_type:complete